MRIYINYNTEEETIINEKNRLAIISNEENYGIHMKNIIDDFNLIIKNLKEYKYIGEENCNGYDCIVIEIKYEFQEKEINNKIWIHKENGVIIKNGNIDYFYQFDCVNEEDVKIPDLSSYKIIENNL